MVDIAYLVVTSALTAAIVYALDIDRYKAAGVFFLVAGMVAACDSLRYRGIRDTLLKRLLSSAILAILGVLIFITMS